MVLRRTRHKIGHFGDVSPGHSLGLVWKNKLNLAQQKARFNQSKETYYNANYYYYYYYCTRLMASFLRQPLVLER